MNHIDSSSREIENSIASVYTKGILGVPECIKEIHKNINEYKITVPETSVDKNLMVYNTIYTNINRISDLQETVKYYKSYSETIIKYISKTNKENTTKHLLSLYSAVRRIRMIKEARIDEYLEGITRIEEMFYGMIYGIMDKLPEVIKKEGGVAYVKIAKIIREEPEEQIEKVLESLLGSIERRFREELGGVDKVLSEECLDFILKDLQLIRETEGLGIPEKYKIFSFSVLHYHRALYEYLDTEADKFDPNEAISLLLWSKRYYAEMKKMGRSKGELGPVLFSGKEEELVNKYISAAKEKLSQWIFNLTKTECKRFRERKKAPDLDSSNKFISIGFMDLLHIIRQQLEPIYEHKQIFKEITKHVSECTEQFKDSLCHCIKEELSLILKDKAKNGFEEYLIAVGNCGLKFMDCLQSLSFYSHSQIQEICNVFYECFLCANDSLVSNIVYVIQPALKHLFTKTWSSEPVSDSIVATFKDYIQDYQSTMIEYSFTTFLITLLEEIPKIYISKSIKKHSYFPKEYIPLITTDRKKYTSLFSKYLSKESISEALYPLDQFISIVNNPNASLILPEIQHILKSDKPVIKEIYTPETIKRILYKMPGGGKTLYSTVMKRLEYSV
ncbi:exocyst complex component 3 [Nematocida sp. AWRm80]|nr:exocyst complex component 3 [Nematocida sp. AWRm80]